MSLFPFPEDGCPLLRLLRLRDVGTDVAVGEGEDFADVCAWRNAHEALWAESNAAVAAHLGLQQWEPGDDDIVVVERFRLASRAVTE